MPDPVRDSPWLGNPWQVDVGREAAVDGGAGNIWDWAQVAASEERGPDLSSGPDESASAQPTEDAYARLVADWPEVTLPVSRHITRSDSHEVYTHWDRHWRNPKRADDVVQCFDYAQYQLLVHEPPFRATGTGRDSTTYYQLFVEERDDIGGRVDVTDVERTAEAIEYVKENLAGGIPVLVGIRLLSYAPRPNPDRTTNHYVVVAGMGQGEGGAYGGECYFTYYDYLYGRPRRFYLFNVPTLALYSFEDDRSHRGYGVAQRRVSQVRRTAPG